MKYPKTRLCFGYCYTLPEYFFGKDDCNNYCIFCGLLLFDGIGGQIVETRWPMCLAIPADA